MKVKNRITSTLLTLLLSLSMIVTYLPATMMAYADTEDAVVEQIDETGNDGVIDAAQESGEKSADEGEPAIEAEGEKRPILLMKPEP